MDLRFLTHQLTHSGRAVGADDHHAAGELVGAVAALAAGTARWHADAQRNHQDAADQLQW